MALEAFKKLNERKKEKILAAIAMSLRKQNYDDLSIQDIACEADISRGSFYNYFSDKNDAVSTLVIENLYKLKNVFTDTIKDSKGKLFDSAEKTLELIMTIMKDQTYYTMLHNLKYIMDITIHIIHSKEFEVELENLIDWLLENTYEGKTYLNTKIKMANVIDMLITVFLNYTLRLVVKTNVNVNYNDFKYRISVIENGIKAAA